MLEMSKSNIVSKWQYDIVDMIVHGYLDYNLVLYQEKGYCVHRFQWFLR